MNKQFGGKGLGFNPGCENFSATENFSTNNSASKYVLGIDYRQIDTTLLDMVEDMIATGRAKPLAAKGWLASLFG